MVLGMQLCYHYNSSGNIPSKPGETILYSLVQNYQIVLKIKKCRKGGIVQALYATPARAFFFDEFDFFRGVVYRVSWATIHIL